MNLRPLDYEPSELPACSIPHHVEVDLVERPADPGGQEKSDLLLQPVGDLGELAGASDLGLSSPRLTPFDGSPMPSDTLVRAVDRGARNRGPLAVPSSRRLMVEPLVASEAQVERARIVRMFVSDIPIVLALVELGTGGGT